MAPTTPEEEDLFADLLENVGPPSPPKPQSATSFKNARLEAMAQYVTHEVSALMPQHPLECIGSAAQLSLNQVPVGTIDSAPLVTIYAWKLTLCTLVHLPYGLKTRSASASK